jgi:hypothetical protein
VFCFVDKTPNAQTAHEKINKCDYIKLRIFCTAKKIIDSEDITYRMEKIFSNYSSNKRLISSVYKELGQRGSSL